MRVFEFLKDHHVVFETRVHPPAYTATRLAKYLHVSGRQVLKCVLLKAGPNLAVAVLPTTRRLHWPGVVELLGSSARLATEQEVGSCFADCEYGSLVPFGRLYGITTLIDKSLEAEHITFAAQRRAMSITMSFADFLRLEQPERWRLAVD
jgi:Ala-tRNA(Pro) deacylase